MRFSAIAATALALCWFAGVEPAASQTAGDPARPPEQPAPELSSLTGAALLPPRLQQTETPNPRLGRMVFGRLLAGVEPAASQTAGDPARPPEQPAPALSSLAGAALLPPRLQQTETPNPRLGRMVLGGLLAGAVGFVGGLYVGDQVTQPDDLALVFAWGLGLESLALPLGVHIGNESRGNPVPGGLISLALGIGGGIATYKSGTAAIVPVFVLAQLIAAVALESRLTPP